MTTIIDKVVAIHRSLQDAGFPYAFGGALALAWCTQQARGTVDIDLNLFVDPDDVEHVLGALPAEVRWSHDDVALIRRDGQARIWWDETPVDLFFNTTEFHARVGSRAQLQPFGGEELPFLSCRDLAVFKAFFNRTRDWADLEAMVEGGSLELDAVLGVLVDYIGPDDERIERLRAIASDTS
jgi:hypothetical protein